MKNIKLLILSVLSLPFMLDAQIYEALEVERLFPFETANMEESIREAQCKAQTYTKSINAVNSSELHEKANYTTMESGKIMIQLFMFTQE